MDFPKLYKELEAEFFGEGGKRMGLKLHQLELRLGKIPSRSFRHVKSAKILWQFWASNSFRASLAHDGFWRKLHLIDLRDALFVITLGICSLKIVPTGRVKVPTGRVKVPAGRYVVPTGKDNVIVSAGRSKVIPAGRTILVLVVLYLLRVDSIVS
ncbi:hypothetical protein Tco_1316708 [Tanacetum coccineum]